MFTFSPRFGRAQVDACTVCEDLAAKIKSPTLDFNAKKAFNAEMALTIGGQKKSHNKFPAVKSIFTN